MGFFHGMPQCENSWFRRAPIAFYKVGRPLHLTPVPMYKAMYKGCVNLYIIIYILKEFKEYMYNSLHS